MRFVKNFRMRRMDKHAYGEVFERRHSTSSRVTRSSGTDPQFRQSYNEDLMIPDFIQWENEVHPSVYPCDDFLRAAGIFDYFYKLISNAGLENFVKIELP